MINLYDHSKFSFPSEVIKNIKLPVRYQICINAYVCVWNWREIQEKTLSPCSDNLGKDKEILQYNLKRVALETWILCYRKTEVNATNDA